MHHQSRQQQQQQQPARKFSDIIVGSNQCYSCIGSWRGVKVDGIRPKNTNFKFTRNTSWSGSKFCDSLQGLSQAAAAAAAATRDSQAPYCSMLYSSTDNQEIFHRKNVNIFQPKPLKLATTGCARTSRTRFPSCHIYQLRLWLKFGILEAWSWSAECPRLATVGLGGSSSSSSSSRSGTAAKMALSLSTTVSQQPGTDPSIGRSIVIILQYFRLLVFLSHQTRVSLIFAEMRSNSPTQLWQSQLSQISYSSYIKLNTFIVLQNHVQYSLPSAIHQKNLFKLSAIHRFRYFGIQF